MTGKPAKRPAKAQALPRAGSSPAVPPAQPVGTVRERVERVLIWVFRENERCDHACKVPLEDVAAGTGLPLPLVVKISRHLEHMGLLEYEKGAVELTVAGMSEAEKAAAPPKAAIV